MQTAPRNVLYARKSTDREDKQVLSIPAQLDELRALAARHGITVTEEVTESWSAREPGRPAFSRLLRDIEAGRVDTIICWKLDRLARNPIDGGAITHHLGKELLKEIIAIDGRYTGTSDTKFMLSVLFGAATKYTDDLSQVVKRGNKAVWERGRITFRPPLGYIKIHDRDGTAGPSVPDLDRFHLVQQLWTEMLTGTTTVPALWRKATQEWGLTSRATRAKPASLLTASALYQLFQNRFYTGQIVVHGDVYPGEHQAMITVAEFERVQELLGRKDAPRPIRHEFVYRGLLHCGDCGRMLSGERIKQRFVYYRCGRRRLGYPACHALAPNEAELTANLEASLHALRMPEETLTWVRELVNLYVTTEGASAVAVAHEREQERAKVEDQLRRLTDLAIQGLVDQDELVSRRAALVERRQTLSSAIDPATELLSWAETVNALLDAGEHAATAFREGTPDERRELLTRLYENLVVTDRKPAPVLRFPFNLLVDPLLRLENGSGGDENLPPPSRILRPIAKSARRGGTRERALQAWWTLLRDVPTLPPKTGLGSQAPPLPAAHTTAPSTPV